MNTQTENETVPTQEDGAEAKPAQQSVETQEADDEDEDEGDAGSNGEDTSEGQRPKRKRPRWSDLNRAHREALDAQAEARRLREQLEQLQRGETPEAAPAERQETAAPKRPTLEEFDFDQERYLEALADWRIEERERAKAQAEKTKAAQQTVQERIATLQSKEAEFAKAHPDYEGVAKSPHVPITQAMANVMLENPDTAPAIAYYLGQNLDEAREIAQMAPLAQARALGLIEAKVSTPTKAPPPPKPVPKTPTVPPTLQPGASGAKDWSQMSTEEHVRAYRERQQKSGR